MMAEGLYRLLVIDDEPEIIEWLTLLLETPLPFDAEVYGAGNATQALAVLEEVRVDVVVSDINMPKMSGLQLAQAIKARWKDCRIIFLSGYDRFEYIYSAQKIEGARYVLKNEDDQVLLGEICSAVEELEEEKRQAQRLELLEQSTYRVLMRQDCLARLISGDCAAGAAFQQTMEQAGLPFRLDGDFYWMIGQLQLPSRDAGELPAHQRMLLVDQMVRERLPDWFYSALHPADADSFLWLIQPDPAVDRGDPLPVIKGAMEVIQENLRLACQARLALVTGSRGCRAGRIPEMLSSALRELKRGGPSRHEILRLSDGGEAADGFVVPYLQYSLKQKKLPALEAALAHGNREQFWPLFEEIAGLLPGAPGMHFPPAVEVYLALAGLFIRHINQNDLLPELAFRAGIGGLGNLGLFRSWTEAKEYLQEIAEAVLALGEDREQKAPTDVIAAVGEFIAAHIHQDISLTQIADAVGLNPSYLSRLFKAETGGNISAAILNAKMDKARAMLQSDKYKIQDIADALGFNTPSYFSHLFRKVTRMSPNEYREHYMKSKGK